MNAREFDIVVYGATGYVGRKVVDYLVQHAQHDGLQWAIAGRDHDKLHAVKAHAGATAEVLIADSQDQASIDEMTASTSVLLNTAGPFAQHGDPVVDACVETQTHYVDISGETPWVRSLIDRYHDQASSEGTRIIPCCGFDSVPSDLGTYLMVRHIQRDLGLTCRQVKAYFQMQGGFNGGTVATVLNIHESGAASQLADPFLLNPPDKRTTASIERNRDVTHPMYDVDIDTWVGPFLMAPVNTRVVRRSAALMEEWNQPYGNGFSYQEYVKFDPPMARLKASAMTAGLATVGRAMQGNTSRDVLRRIAPKPGQGPSERSMQSGWFVCELLGVASDGRRVRGVMRHQGDPSNLATARFVCESALCLVENSADLPGGIRRGGILTPATGLGDVLATRLRRSGMSIDVPA